MKKKGEKPGAWRIITGMAGVVIVIAAGIGLSVFTGQNEEPTPPQEAQSVPYDSADGKETKAPTQPREEQADNEPAQS